ncbi:MAG: GGDEF domain-containing protein [Gammaproteobacteria bacterium]|nr:GGDEF domain-containing protein [Gammaproteobacteria bacterium]
MFKNINSVNYRIVLVITLLTFGLSLSITLVSYYNSISQTYEQLINRSMPLTIDNVYSEIQQTIIEPNLISSVMANDTFVKAWLQQSESDEASIQKYLATIHKKYDMFTTFLVSENSKRYYSQKGYVETLSPKKDYNQWYFDFRKSPADREVNIDTNAYLGAHFVMFINFKIYDDNNQLLGATGVGLKTDYIDTVLRSLREKYGFNVYLINKAGEVVIKEHDQEQFEAISESPELQAKYSELMGDGTKLLEYDFEGHQYLVRRTYIEDLDLYLLVEARFDNFTQQITRVFYLNILMSLLITLVVTFVILFYVRRYNERLTYLATHDVLTELTNRTFLHQQLTDFLAREHHKVDNKPQATKALQASLLFLDIDNFKSVNDTYGHGTGDKVLKRIGQIISSSVRYSDFAARWGGEEFAIALYRVSPESTKQVAEQLRQKIATDPELIELVNHPVTASFGVTTFKSDDTVVTLFARADDALYTAKRQGKNQVVYN